MEVVSLRDANKFDTVLTIQTEQKVYFFYKDSKEYMCTVDKKTSDVFMVAIIVFFFGMIVGAASAILYEQ